MENTTILTSLSQLYFDFEKVLVLLHNVERRLGLRIQKHVDNHRIEEPINFSEFLTTFTHLEKNVQQLESSFNEIAKTKILVDTLKHETDRKTQTLLNFLSNVPSQIRSFFEKDIQQLHYCISPKTHESLPSSLSCLTYRARDYNDNKTNQWTCTTSPTPINSYKLSRDQKVNYFSNTLSNSLNESTSMMPPDFSVLEPSLTPSQQHRSNSFLRRNACPSQEPFKTYDTQSIADTCHTAYTYKEPFHTPIGPKKIHGVGKNITLDEFETVPLLLRRRVKLDEVNNLYYFLIQIQSNFTRTRRPSCSKKNFVNIKELINKGFISSGRKGTETLGILRYLKRIQLTNEEFVPSTRAYLLTPRENYYPSVQPFSYLPNPIVYQPTLTPYSIPEQDSFYFMPPTSTYSPPSTTFSPPSGNFPPQSTTFPTQSTNFLPQSTTFSPESATPPLTTVTQPVVPDQFYQNNRVQNDKNTNSIQYEQPYYTGHIPQAYALSTPALDTFPNYAVSTQPPPIHVTLIPYETFISIPSRNKEYNYDKKSSYHGSSLLHKKQMRNSRRQIDSWLLNTEVSPFLSNQNIVPRHTVALSPIFNLTA